MPRLQRLKALGPCPSGLPAGSHIKQATSKISYNVEHAYKHNMCKQTSTITSYYTETASLVALNDIPFTEKTPDSKERINH